MSLGSRKEFRRALLEKRYQDSELIEEILASFCALASSHSGFEEAASQEVTRLRIYQIKEAEAKLECLRKRAGRMNFMEE